MPQLPPLRELGSWDIPPGDKGTEATIGAMHALASDAAGNPRSLTAQVARQLRGAYPGQTAARIRQLLADVVRFEFDPPDLELVRHPDRMLLEVQTNGGTQGDCDDIATLGAALGMAAGLPIRYVTVAMRRGGPYTHVWTELQDGGAWRELDTSRELQGIPPDWRPPRVATWNP